MFNKIVAIEPVNFLPSGKEELKKYAKEIVFYDSLPKDSSEIVKRIGDADAILISYTQIIGADILSKCPNLKYVGMCCSLYSKFSCNVDIDYAEKHNITVTGIRDYGDEGVREYVVSELVQLLHGYSGNDFYYGRASELTNLKVGILGMGTTGKIVANALLHFGCDVYYYSRTRKEDMEEKGVKYLELVNLLPKVDCLCSCLSKNVVLLHEEEFKLFGNHKIMFNTSLSPCYDIEPFKKWLDNKDNRFFSDTLMALGPKELLEYKNVKCANQSAGMTMQAVERLNKKVLDNIKNFFAEV